MATATRPSRDQVVIRLATEEGVTDQGVIARRLIEMGYPKIGPERVGQILRANSGRDQILRFIEEHPDETFTSVEISTWTKIDINKVNYVIDALQKKGIVTYKVGRADNDHRSLVDIAMTKRARAQLAARVAEVIAKSEAVDHAGLKVTRADNADTSQDVVVDDDATQVMTPQAVADAALDEVERAEGAHTVLPRAVPDEEPDDEPDMPIMTVLKYPLIGKLLDRERDLNEAAHLLDRHGLDELELAVLAKMEEYTPLEREVVAYVRAHLKSCKQ